jgi:hypothetical protein
MDAITMLRADHRAVEKLFKRFEDAGPRAFVEKRKIVDRIIEELSVHAAVEEQLFYPATRATVPAVEEVALESLEEHHVVKWLLSELEDMDPEDERFSAKVTVLIESVRHHVREEESEYFREVRSELGAARVRYQLNLGGTQRPTRRSSLHVLDRACWLPGQPPATRTSPDRRQQCFANQPRVALTS